MAELVPIAFEIPGEVERPRSRGRSAVNERVPIDRARPDWLKVRLPMGPQVEELRRLMRSKSHRRVIILSAAAASVCISAEIECMVLNKKCGCN